MMPLTLTIPPRPAAGIQPPAPPAAPAQTSTTAPQSSSKQKFHRPFEVGSTTSSSGSTRPDKIRTGKVATVATAADSRGTLPARRNGDSSSQDVLKMSPLVIPNVRPQPLFSAAPPPPPPADDLPLNLVCRHSDSQSAIKATPVRTLSAENQSGPVRCSTVPVENRSSSSSSHSKQEPGSSVLLPLPPLPPPSPLVSKIDHRILRKQSRRRQAAAETVGPVTSDEEDDEEEDQDSDADINDVQHQARLMVITTGPPFKHEPPPAKRKFLESFELVSSNTHSGKESLISCLLSAFCLFSNSTLSFKLDVVGRCSNFLLPVIWEFGWFVIRYYIYDFSVYFVISV